MLKIEGVCVLACCSDDDQVEASGVPVVPED